MSDMEGSMEASTKTGKNIFVESSYLNDNVPCLPLLMGKLAFKKSTFQITDTLPNISAEKKDFVINPNHLAKFKTLCGSSQNGGIPPT